MAEGPGPGKVLVIACGALAHELVKVRDLNGWNHMEFQCLPAEYHNYPQKIPAAVREKIRVNRPHFRRIFIGYSDCGTGGLLDAVIEEEGVERLPGAHCYEMFAGSRAFQALHDSEPGTFYLTDFLALHFDRLIVKGLGLDRFPELREQYFGNYRKLVYLAQQDAEDIESKARQAADCLGLEFEKVRTGYGFLQSALSVAVNGPAPSAD